jgi:hypothetical protein
VTIDGVWIGYWIYWHICTHQSEPQVITALSLISTLYISLHHPVCLFPDCCLFNSRFLATASNSRDSSASCAHVVTVRRIYRNWTLVNCELNYSASLAELDSNANPQLTQPAWGPRYRLQQSLYCRYGQFPSDSPDIVSAGTCLPSRCSATHVPSRVRCTVTVLHATILIPNTIRHTYLHTGQQRHRINAHTDIHASSGIRTHDPSVRESEGGSCLRPRGHCDRPNYWLCRSIDHK